MPADAKKARDHSGMSYWGSSPNGHFHSLWDPEEDGEAFRLTAISNCSAMGRTINDHEQFIYLGLGASASGIRGHNARAFWNAWSRGSHN